MEGDGAEEWLVMGSLTGKHENLIIYAKTHHRNSIYALSPNFRETELAIANTIELLHGLLDTGRSNHEANRFQPHASLAFTYPVPHGLRAAESRS